MLEAVAISNEVCRLTGEKLRNALLKPSFYQRPFLKVKAPAEILLRGYFYAVAICHQTYQLHHKILNLFGWDYIEYVFYRLMKMQAPFLSPAFLKDRKQDDIENILAGFFPSGGENNVTSLDLVPERAELLIELDGFVRKKFGSFESLVSHTHEYLLENGNGFYELLPAVAAFQDPYRKKITFLLKLLEEAQIVTIRDPWNYIPIMDYHMQRVLMRLGCIEIKDTELRDRLIRKEKLDSDTAIRSACIEAFRLISGYSDVTITRLNDYFWSLGRSCCNEKPLCEFHQCEKIPCTFEQIVLLDQHNSCYFSDCCKGYNSNEYRQLWQPVVKTHYY